MTPEWMKVAMGEIGTTEVVGRTHNPRILEYHAATGLHASNDETSWCGSFVAWCLQQSGVDYKNVFPQAAAARTWLRFGHTLKTPTYGCIIIFWRKSPTSWEGHVGFFVGWADENHEYVKVLGGNQRNRVEIMEYKSLQILGFRWPASIPLPSAEQGIRQSGVLQGATAAVVTTTAVVADNATEIVDGLNKADQQVKIGTVFGFVAGLVILVALAYTIISRVRGGKEMLKIGDPDSLAAANAKQHPRAK